jgi:predicted  nucleic acid-binding Zn-ribbon protein
MSNGESHFSKKDKLLEQDMADMIEYVRMITDQIIELRQRTRAAEQVINQLRKSGETSVEALLDTLFVLRRKQEKLDKELDEITSIVQSKEALIKVKEDEKSSI